MDETRIDAAPTPAHVFAYRAFRSVFVASPESSPIRPQVVPYNDKENILGADARYLKTSTSPSHTKRKSAGKDLLSLTPKRQKTVAISPTKSILKNPNAPTPRRPGLRDINVTFKDIRKSASPDLAQRLTVMSINSQSGLRVASEPLVKLKIAEDSPKVQNPTTAVSTKPHIVQTVEEEHAAMVADIVRNPAFDVNDYVVKTEKELRRFAAYGKKWKKYAQKQDQEVERLKALLEEVQKENERLRRRMANAKEAKDVDDLQIEIESEREKERNKPSKQKSFSGSKKIHGSRSPQKDTDRAIQADLVLEIANTKPMSDTAIQPFSGQNREFIKSRETKCPRNLDTTNPRASHTKIQPSTSVTAQEPHPKAQVTKSPAQWLVDENKPLPKPDDTSLRSVSAAPSLSAAVRTSMTSDRKAAARERLRLKNEERMASLRLSSAPMNLAVEKSIVAVHSLASIPTVVDESELDWADLGQ